MTLRQFVKPTVGAGPIRHRASPVASALAELVHPGAPIEGGRADGLCEAAGITRLTASSLCLLIRGMRYSLLGLVLTAPVGLAQWLNHPTPGLPRLASGKPNLAAPVRKGRDGKPDLSGVWLAKGDPCDSNNSVTAGLQRPKYFVSAAGCLNPDLPMLPWAREVFQKRRAGNSRDLPISSCKPLSTPMRDAFPLPFKLVQTPGLILLLYEQDTVFRQVFLDGRALPKDPEPSWLGYSVGRWEGDSLVVETIGFHDRDWLDSLGHPHSDALHMEERFRRVDLGHLDIQVTFTDPKTYARPITFTQPHDLLPDTDLLEFFCTDNERDQQHLVTP